MAEWLANLKIQYVIAAAVILFLTRIALGKHKTPIAKSAAEIVESALIAIVLVFLIIRPFVIQAFYIPSESMLPTLRVRDHILVNKLVYRFRGPRHGEIIVFKSPPGVSNNGEAEVDFIKRLIGRPGDVIEVKDGALYRNGKRLDEPYVRDKTITYSMEPRKIPQGTIWVMGDNRNNSNDSHAWGPLDEQNIIGKAMVRFWPPGRVGIVR